MVDDCPFNFALGLVDFYSSSTNSERTIGSSEMTHWSLDESIKYASSHFLSFPSSKKRWVEMDKKEPFSLVYGHQEYCLPCIRIFVPLINSQYSRE